MFNLTNLKMNLFLAYIKIAMALRQFGLEVNSQNYKKVLSALDKEFEPIFYEETKKIISWKQLESEPESCSSAKGAIFLGLSLLQLEITPNFEKYSKILENLKITSLPKEYLQGLKEEYLLEILKRATEKAESQKETKEPEKAQEVEKVVEKPKPEPVISAADLFDF